MGLQRGGGGLPCTGPWGGGWGIPDTRWSPPGGPPGGVKAVGGGYYRLQVPLKPALGVRGTVAGRWLGALEVKGREVLQGLYRGCQGDPCSTSIAWGGVSRSLDGLSAPHGMEPTRGRQSGEGEGDDQGTQHQHQQPTHGRP